MIIFKHTKPSGCIRVGYAKDVDAMNDIFIRNGFNPKDAEYRKVRDTNRDGVFCFAWRPGER